MSNLQNIGLQIVAMNRQARANRAQQELEERRLALAEQDNELARMQFSENKRQYDNSYNENRRQFNEQTRQYNNSYNENRRQFDEQTRQFNKENELAVMQQKIDQQNADSYTDQIEATVNNMNQARQFEADDRTQKRNGNLWRSTAGKLYDYTDPDNPVMRNADDWYESGDLARLVPLFRQAGVLRNTELDGYDIIPNSIQRSGDGIFSVTGIDKNGGEKQFTVTADQINNAASLASLRRESNVHVFGQASDPTKQQYLTRDGLAQIARETGMGAEEQRQQSVSEPWVDDRVPQTLPPQTAAPKPDIEPTTPSATPFLPGMTEEQAAFAAESSAKDKALHDSQAIERAKNATGRMKVSASKRLKELGKGNLSIADPVVQEKVNTPPTPQAVEKANATVEKAKSKKITAQEKFNTVTAKIGSGEWGYLEASNFAKHGTTTPGQVVINGKKINVADIAKGLNPQKFKKESLKYEQELLDYASDVSKTISQSVLSHSDKEAQEALKGRLRPQVLNTMHFLTKLPGGQELTTLRVGGLLEAFNYTRRISKSMEASWRPWIAELEFKDFLPGLVANHSNLNNPSEDMDLFDEAYDIVGKNPAALERVMAEYVLREELKLSARSKGANGPEYKAQDFRSYLNSVQEAQSTPKGN